MMRVVTSQKRHTNVNVTMGSYSVQAHMVQALTADSGGGGGGGFYRKAQYTMKYYYYVP